MIDFNWSEILASTVGSVVTIATWELLAAWFGFGRLWKKRRK